MQIQPLFFKIRKKTSEDAFLQISQENAEGSVKLQIFFIPGAIFFGRARGNPTDFLMGSNKRILISLKLQLVQGWRL